MKAAVPILLVLFSLPLWSAEPPRTIRRPLAAATKIQEYPCDRGYAWFYSDGRLSRCTLSREASFGEALLPSGSIIHLTEQGRPQFAFLSHNAVLGGYEVMGGSWLGTGEGNITAFYPSGKLKSAYLVRDQWVQGVPCRGGQWGILTDPQHGGNAVQFYENGKLKGCKVSVDFQGVASRHRIALQP
jgi:hypothetical protein